MAKTIKTRLQLKKDTSANWEKNNPILLDGEKILVVTNAGEIREKIGDGTKSYTQLPFTDEGLKTLISNKVDKVSGKGLSANDYTTAEKNKLAGIAAGANNYTHPSSHAASMITQDATHRFVSDTEKSTWNSKAGTSVASSTANGLMSKEDKIKLNGIAEGANAYTHPSYTAKASGLYKVTVDSTGHVSATAAVSKADITGLGIPAQDTTYSDMKAATADADGAHGLVPAPAAGKQGQYLRGDGTWATPTNTTYGDATTSNHGLMTATDKAKLDGIAEGANKYSHPSHTAAKNGLYKVTVDALGHVSGTTAVSKADITGLGIPAQDTTYNDASTTSHGLMTADMVAKLNGIASNANNYTHPTYTAKTSGLYKVAVDGTGHVSATAAVAKSDITALGIPAQDTTYSDMKAATVDAAGGHGLVPAPAKGQQGQYLRGDGTWSTPTNTTYGDATTTNHGLMTAAMVTKLNGIADGANKYTHPGYTAKTAGLYKVAVDSTGHVSTATAVAKEDITGLGIPGQDTTYSAVTTDTDGLMSSADKSKLDGIAAGANKYSHPSYTARSAGLYKITIDASGHVSNVAAVAKSDITGLGIPAQDTTYADVKGATADANGTHGLVPAPTKGASNRYLRSDGTWQVPPDTNTTYGDATATAHGLMTAAMVTKLNGIADGANKTTVDDALSSTSTNPVQNKVVNTALAGKSNTGHTHTKSEITDFPTSLKNPTALTIQLNGTSQGGYDGSTAKTVNITAASVGAAASNHTHTAAAVGADAAGSAASALTNAKAYTDTKISDLINGAPETLDTLGEIATAMNDNKDVVEALQTAVGNKADSSALTSHTGNTTVHITAAERTAWNGKASTAVASTSANGLMSKDDKSKLDGIAAGANNYTHPAYTAKTSGLYKVTVDATGHVSATAAVAKADITALGIPGSNTTYSAMTGATADAAGTAGLVPAPAKGASTRYLRSDGTWQTPPNTTYGAASTSTNGLMTSAMVTKLNGIATGANAYTHPTYSAKSAGFYKITVDGTGHVSDVTAVSKADITGLGIPAQDTTYSVMTGATSIANGTSGLVPIPYKGKESSFLRGDGTWATPTNTTYSNMKAATADAPGTAGLVPAPAAGKQTSFLRGDGTWVVPTNTTYNDATTSNHGLMTAAMVTKLNGIATGANAYTHPSYTAKTSGLYKITVDALGHVSATTAVAKSDITALGIPSTNTTYSTMTAATANAAGGSGLVPAPAKGQQGLYLRGDGTWATPTNTTYGDATTSSHGLMTAAMVTNLNSLLTRMTAAETAITNLTNKLKTAVFYE